MKPYPFIFRPSIKEKIWGGTRLNKIFNCGLQENIGEAWVISDHPSGKSIIVNGVFVGRTLGDLLHFFPEWFCSSEITSFPLLVKFLHSNKDLSVQVHPDDQYVKRNEGAGCGKTECWYIIDCCPGAEIVLGHKARDRQEFIELAEKDKWDELLVRIPVRPGDFFFIPSGTVHAIGRGIVLLEVQQNSDITYRIYDYDRTGPDGKKRDLHFAKALDVINFKSNTNLKACEKEIGFRKILLSCQFFIIERWLINKSCSLNSLDVFLLICVISGKGKIIYGKSVFTLTIGSSIFIPANMGKYQIKGNIEAIVCYIDQYHTKWR